jgi:hypothetical protein
MLLAMLVACLGRAPVRHSVEPVDVAVVQPTPSITQAEQSLAAARERLADAQTALTVAEGARRAAESQLTGARADMTAAEAEYRAAEANRDTDRRIEALRRGSLARKHRDAMEAQLDWRTVEREARQARVDANRAEFDLRRAELELERAEWLVNNRRTDDYTLSDFIAQRARLRERWEKASRDETEAQRAVEAARRKYAAIEAEGS